MNLLIAFGMIFFLFSSCNLAPRLEIPDMDLNTSYRFEGEEIKAYANIAWWKQFGDPKLNELINLALENNQNLKVASARVLEYYAKYRVVFSALLPELDAQGNIDRIRLSEDIDYQPPIPGVPRINTLYSFLFELSYEVDFWGRIRNLTDAAKAVYLQQVNARRNVVLTLVTNVAATYIYLKQLINQRRISELTFRSRLESWEIAQLRFEGGIVSLLDVKQAESEALDAEVQIKNFEILIAQQEDLLSTLIGEIPGPIDSGLTIEQLYLPNTLPSGLPADLLTNRPDILESEEAIRAANADVGAARAAFLPAFNLTGIYGQRSTDWNNFFKSTANLFDLGLQAFQPLFTGFRLTSKLSESEAVLLEALHSYQQTILTALQEVEDALIKHEKNKEKNVIQKKRVASLEKYLELAELRYFNGQNDYLTVINAQTSLFIAELSEAQTEGELFISLINLYKALGQGWEVDEPECSCNEAPIDEEIEPEEEKIIVAPTETPVDEGIEAAEEKVIAGPLCGNNLKNREFGLEATPKVNLGENDYCSIGSDESNTYPKK